jgi:hypothetical protein
VCPLLLLLLLLFRLKERGVVSAPVSAVLRLPALSTTGAILRSLPRRQGLDLAATAAVVLAVAAAVVVAVVVAVDVVGRHQQQQQGCSSFNSSNSTAIGERG